MATDRAGRKKYMREYMRRFRSTGRGREITALLAHKHYLKHGEHMRETQRVRRESSPDKSRIMLQRYRSRKNSVASDFTLDQWKYMLELFNYRCAYCGRESDHLHQDHVVPVSKGGDYTAENIVPACPRCNLSKGNKKLIYFLLRETLKHKDHLPSIYNPSP